jgi:hypothetical protein
LHQSRRRPAMFEIAGFVVSGVSLLTDLMKEQEA